MRSVVCVLVITGSFLARTLSTTDLTTVTKLNTATCTAPSLPCASWPTSTPSTRAHDVIVVAHVQKQQHFLFVSGWFCRAEQKEEHEVVLATIKMDSNGVLTIKPDFNKGRRAYRTPQARGRGNKNHPDATMLMLMLFAFRKCESFFQSFLSTSLSMRRSSLIEWKETEKPRCTER